MFNIFIGFFAIFMFAIAIVLLVLAIAFRKNKTAKTIMLSLGGLFVLIPIALFLVFRINHSQKSAEYSGVYTSDNCKLQLLSDGTFVLNATSCPNEEISGTWTYEIGDTYNYIQFDSEFGQLPQAITNQKGLSFQGSIKQGICHLTDVELQKRIE